MEQGENYMTDIDKYIVAKRVIDCLANGYNPYDEKLLPDDTILNNAGIVRALFIASDALDKYLKSEKKKNKKIEFGVSYQALERFAYSDTPITISEMSRRINDLKGDIYMKNFKYTVLIEWLLKKGLIYEQEYNNGKKYKEATELGNEIGITSVWRKSLNGAEYRVTLYDVNAQHFIIDNLNTIIEEKAAQQED